MKSKTKIFSTLFLMAGILTGCSDSFLDRTPEGSYTDANFYASDEALEAATAPLYNRAWFDYNQRAIVPIGSGRANDMYSPWGSPEFTTFQVTALNELLSAAWKSFYSVITMSNSVISDVREKSTGDVSEEAKARAIAEARLMRGCAYFYMLRAWGSVILIEDNQKVVDDPVLPLNREEDVFQFIINDFAYAAANLPEKGDQPGRATCWAAKGMLAKAYLARSGWKKGGQREDSVTMPTWNWQSSMRLMYAKIVVWNLCPITKIYSNTNRTTIRSHCLPCSGCRLGNGEYATPCLQT